MGKKIIYFIAIAAVLFLFYSLSQQVYQSLRAGNRLDSEVETLAALQKKNSELKKQLLEVDSLQFIEKEARDKLNLSRPGETIVVIPEANIQKVLDSWQEKKVEIIPNWQGWLRLFSK